jgi:hypothetical protein
MIDKQATKVIHFHSSDDRFCGSRQIACWPSRRSREGGHERRIEMTHADAITLDAILKGRAWPKTSNFDKPIRRIWRLTERGLLHANGADWEVTAAGRAALNAHAEKNGWVSHPVPHPR